VLGVILLMLAVDLFAHRKAAVIGPREAPVWSGIWLALVPVRRSSPVGMGQ
jgi:tellurite resistance protein TerC